MNIYDHLPLEVNPVYWGHDVGNMGFTLEDQFGLTIIAKGNTYKINNKIIEIDRVLGYGFSETLLVSKVLDAEMEPYLVLLDEERPSETKVIGYSDSSFTNLKLSFIDIDGSGEYMHRLTQGRRYLVFFMAGALFLLIFNVLKTKFRIGNSSGNTSH